MKRTHVQLFSLLFMVAIWVIVSRCSAVTTIRDWSLCSNPKDGASVPALPDNSEPSIRTELIDLQKREGTSLAFVKSNDIYAVNLEKRSSTKIRAFLHVGTASRGEMASDGAEVAFDFCPDPGLTHPTPFSTKCPAGPPYLAVVQTDGSGLREFRDLVYPTGECWSGDRSRLALTTSNRKTNKFAVAAINVVNLGTASIQETRIQDASTSSQCWSRDAKELVYVQNEPNGIQTVRVFDVEKNVSRDLAKGSHATWSPDGNWIAFLDCGVSLHDCTYVVTRPSGGDRRVLFKIASAETGLWWSPDSRLVAYVSPGPAFMPDAGMYRLFVRRLDDNSEDWFANLSDTDSMAFQWVTNL